MFTKCFLLLLTTTSMADSKQMPLTSFIQIIKSQQGTLGPSSLHIHSKKLLKLVKDSYSSKDLDGLSLILKPAVEIKVHPNGLVQASDRPLNSKDDPTHYDAVWVRDTLWTYLGLQAQKKTDLSKNVLLKMLDYFSSPDQLKRFAAIIAHPEIINRPDGAMEVVHIRFDGGSKTFQDIQINNQAQKWNHKQNDALGLFFDLFLRAAHNGTFKFDEISSKQYEALAYFPAYFSQIKFYEMEDAGSWEEIEKVATSSVGLVTSSLERLVKTLQSSEIVDKNFALKLQEASSKLNLTPYQNINRLNSLISQGYDCITKQIKSGGESPLYKKDDPRYRTADAALLNLIYPAQLSKLTSAQKLQIINLVSSLVGEVGVKRYIGDSYQAGNFWFQTKANADDNSSARDFTARGKGSIPHSEAQWFFDSWFSKCAGLLFSETNDPSLRTLEITHFNRSLGQLTGGSNGEQYLSADGAPVTPFSLPESYNTVVLGKLSYFAPSPITPLNWAKASLLIALDELKSH